METQESPSEDLCESENGTALVGSSSGNPSDRKSAIVVQKDDGLTSKVDPSETAATTETCLDLCRKPIAVKECPVKNTCPSPKDLLQSEQQHGSSEDDDDEEEDDDDDDDDDSEDADVEDDYDNVNDNDANDDDKLEGDMCGGDGDHDDDDDDDDKRRRDDMISSEREEKSGEEEGEGEGKREEAADADDDLEILTRFDLTDASSKVQPEHKISEPKRGKVVEVCAGVPDDVAAGKLEESTEAECSLVTRKERKAKNLSKVEFKDETVTQKREDFTDEARKSKISNISESCEDKVVPDNDNDEVNSKTIINEGIADIDKNKNNAGVLSSVSKTDDSAKTPVSTQKSKEEVDKDAVRSRSIKDNIPVTDGKGVRKLSSSTARKDDALAEPTAKDTCSKPKCILTPMTVVTSEFQPRTSGEEVTSQPGGGNVTHRVLHRQRMTMAPPPPTPISGQTHIPRLHRHCVMSYDGGGTGGGSGIGHATSSTSSSTGRLSSSRVSPTQNLRRESVEEDDGVGGVSQQQYVVNVHVNPGETFSVCVSDQVQLIQGPATVRMVSNNGPPLPMPMQVPPGHMVQQIIDENGILTNVILSSQPPGIPAPPMMVGYYGNPNGTPPHHVYSPYGPPYPPYPSQYTMHHHHHHPHHPPAPPPPHVHHPMGPPRMHGTSPPHHCNSHGHPPPPPHLPTGHPPQQFHLSHSTMTADGRPCSKGRPHNRNYKSKIHRDRDRDRYCISSSLQSAPQTKSTPRSNGVALRVEPQSESSSSDDPELEEERRIIQEILSKMPPPKVLEIETRSVLIVLTPPDFKQKDCDLESTEIQYELHLSEKKDSHFNLVYSGDATEITLRDLKPATEYHLKVHSIFDDIKSNQTETLTFKTLSCEPNVPLPPKLISKTTTSLYLKWSPVADNGSKITSYILQSDQGLGDSSSFITFVEIYNDLHHLFRVTKLNPSTRYTFRLAAVNAEGTSDFSDLVCYCTSGTAPTQPDPPMLSEQFVSSLTVSWIKRPRDDVFSLKMDDEATGRGFVLIYTGTNLSFTVQHLHRNTEYRFRLQAGNEDGSSPWSDVVKYRTLPDKPQPPPRPQVKGKVHPHSFRVVWDCPKDSGGNEITLFILQIDSGNGFESVYSGLVCEFIADSLVPGHTYWLRVACVSSIGQSEWSDVLSVITQIVPPGQCTGLSLQGKPQATTIHIRWALPDFTGGAPFSDYEVLMTNPDGTACEVYRGPDMECTVTGLLPGRTYLFQVRCLNRAGAGPWSESLEVVSGASVPDPPPQPTIICRSPHTAHISWGESTGNGAPVTEYRLEWQQRDCEFSELFCGLSITAEVNGLLPAMMYSFRVQAVNSAGAGPFSAIASCVTPPSNPGPVTSVRASSMATSIHVTWKEPCENGAKVTAYNLSVDDGTLIAVGNVLDYSIEDLQPETFYKVRVQAVNAIGLGAFSYPVKIMTRSLPPRPPVIECIAAGCNSLKLKWKDSHHQPDLFQYCLEMLRADGSFHPVYQGSGHSHKVSKLSELTHYEFRIYSSNAAGDGPYSEVFKFSTLKAPPGIVKAVHILSLATESAVVEWLPLKPLGADDIVYILQLQAVNCRDQTFKEVYQGSETSFRLAGLSFGSEYRVRVCAVRQTKDRASVLVGPFSQAVAFFTDSPKPACVGAALGAGPAKTTERRKLSDQQWAVVLLGCFTIFAIFLAFLANLIISQTTGVGAGPDAIGDLVRENTTANTALE